MVLCTWNSFVLFVCSSWIFHVHSHSISSCCYYWIMILKNWTIIKHYTITIFSSNSNCPLILVCSSCSIKVHSDILVFTFYINFTFINKWGCTWINSYIFSVVTINIYFTFIFHIRCWSISNSYSHTSFSTIININFSTFSIFYCWTYFRIKSKWIITYYFNFIFIYSSIGQSI